MRIPRTLALVVLLAAAPCGGPAARAGEPTVITIDHDDIDVTTDVIVKPGVYRVEDKNGDGVLRIKADGVRVVMTGVTLDGAPPGREPDAFDGVGVSIEKHDAVTIEGGAIRGFRVGVRGASAPGLRLERIDASHNRAMRLKSTPDREDASDWLWPHENDDGQWEKTYGAGISLTSCPKATATRCNVHRGQNGILLTGCDEARVEGCDFSFNSGWGIAMYRSGRCLVERNRCDWCVRGYSHGVYARGQDSAGILVFEQCSHNMFRLNSATHSGDGFFLYAGNETLKKTGQGGCNENTVEHCDFSHAVANGIEATFSRGNRFLENRLDDCEDAIWAGYSRDTFIDKNSAEGCANGISIEHGQDNTLMGNVLADCRTGIHLWWDPDPELTQGVFGKAQDTSSSKNSVLGNVIVGGDVALRLESDTATRVQGNRIRGAQIALAASGKTVLASSSGNVFIGPQGGAPTMRCETEAPLALASNWWGAPESRPTVIGSQKMTFAGSDSPPSESEQPRQAGIRLAHLREQESGSPARFPFPFLPDDAPRGRAYILIGEWGPLDPRAPALFPQGYDKYGAAIVQVLGPGVPYRVESLTAGLIADRPDGKTPDSIRIRRKDLSAKPSLIPFDLAVKVGDATLSTRGTVLTTEWKVKFFYWKTDPREDAAAWKALIAGPPSDAIGVPVLDFSWGAEKPAAHVPADHFATVAETTLTLPPGPYLVRTTSDDGIRVLVDEKVVLEDWTHHAPKDDSATITLTEGPHAFRVEHFEIDGWAALRFSIARAP